MFLNCGVGEDSWESLRLQGDQTSQSDRKSVLNIHWKDWCWNWNSNTLATWCKELTSLERPDAGKGWRQEEKGTTEDEMVGWHHWLDGHEFEQAPGVSDGQGSLACFSPWGLKELDTIEPLNWTGWEKIIVNETTDKELISKIYKQLIQLKTRKTNSPIRVGKRNKKAFLQRRHTDDKETHEKMFNITHH